MVISDMENYVIMIMRKQNLEFPYNSDHCVNRGLFKNNC